MDGMYIIISAGLAALHCLLIPHQARSYTCTITKIESTTVYTVDPYYNGHLGAKSSWLLYRGGLFTE